MGDARDAARMTRNPLWQRVADSVTVPSDEPQEPEDKPESEPDDEKPQDTSMTDTEFAQYRDDVLHIPLAFHVAEFLIKHWPSTGNRRDANLGNDPLLHPADVATYILRHYPRFLLRVKPNEPNLLERARRYVERQIRLEWPNPEVPYEGDLPEDEFANPQ